MSSKNQNLPVSQSQNPKEPSPKLESEEVYRHAGAIVDEEIYDEITNFYTEEDFSAISPNYDNLSHRDKTELAFLLIGGDMPEVWNAQREWRHINEFLQEIKTRVEDVGEDPEDIRDYFMNADPLHVQEAKGSEGIPSEVYDTDYSSDGVMFWGRDEGDYTVTMGD